MIKVSVLTISDRCSRGEAIDESGPALIKLLGGKGFDVTYTDIIPDEIDSIESRLIECADKMDCAVILTTGGTGFGPRDKTPEATLRVIDREVPGISELIRQEGLKRTSRAALSRAISGLRGKTLIVNLPGSPRGATESLALIVELLPHAVDMIMGEGH